MLLLLLLAALSHMTQGQTMNVIAIAECPFRVGETTRGTIYMTLSEGETSMCFNGHGTSNTETNICFDVNLGMDSSTVNVIKKEGEPCSVYMELKKGQLKKPGEKYCRGDNVVTCNSHGFEETQLCLQCNSGKCLIGTVCTVTGSSVITFSKTLVNIPDFCRYLLLKNIGLTLEATFSERRRTDVNLLDTLHLTVLGKKISIKPGQVKLEGTVVDLDAPMPEDMPSGLTIVKTTSGVSLEMSEMFSLGFDGTSAIIAVKVLEHQASGLCLNGPAEDLKETELSPPRCDVVAKQAPDEDIDCDAIIKHCELLNSDPFTSCHSIVSQVPFVAACKETLCKYPSVDGLSCNFHRAYAAACAAADHKLSDWSTVVTCDSTADSCGLTYCSSHEFCGVHLNEVKCLCRALFAATYPIYLGEPTVCSQSSASLSLATCLLTQKGVQYKELQLLDSTCKGSLDEDTHLLSFSFDSTNTCGAKVTEGDGTVVFSNKVVMKDFSNDLVTRHDQFEVDFSCSYSQPAVKTMPLKIKDSSVVETVESGDWTYTLTMKAYMDAGLTQAIAADTELQLDQKVWVELSTVGLDPDLVTMVTDSCWATSEDKSDAKVKYNLVVKGCANPQDLSVAVKGNGVGVANSFSFNMFQFTGKSSDVYLHCLVKLCVPSDTNVCAPVCSGSRRRRSLYSDPSPGLISMSWAH